MQVQNLCALLCHKLQAEQPQRISGEFCYDCTSCKRSASQATAETNSRPGRRNASSATFATECRPCRSRVSTVHRGQTVPTEVDRGDSGSDAQAAQGQSTADDLCDDVRAVHVQSISTWTSPAASATTCRHGRCRASLAFIATTCRLYKANAFSATLQRRTGRTDARNLWRPTSRPPWRRAFASPLQRSAGCADACHLQPPPQRCAGRANQGSSSDLYRSAGHGWRLCRSEPCPAIPAAKRRPCWFKESPATCSTEGMRGACKASPTTFAETGRPCKYRAAVQEQNMSGKF